MPAALIRRRRRRDDIGQAAFAWPGTARAFRRRSRSGNRAPSSGTDAGPATRADDVMRVLDAAHPVAHRFVDARP